MRKNSSFARNETCSWKFTGLTSSRFDLDYFSRKSQCSKEDCGDVNRILGGTKVANPDRTSERTAEKGLFRAFYWRCEPRPPRYTAVANSITLSSVHEVQRDLAALSSPVGLTVFSPRSELHGSFFFSPLTWFTAEMRKREQEEWELRYGSIFLWRWCKVTQCLNYRNDRARLRRLRRSE